MGRVVGLRVVSTRPAVARPGMPTCTDSQDARPGACVPDRLQRAAWLVGQGRRTYVWARPQARVQRGRARSPSAPPTTARLVPSDPRQAKRVTGIGQTHTRLSRGRRACLRPTQGGEGTAAPSLDALRPDATVAGIGDAREGASVVGAGRQGTSVARTEHEWARRPRERQPGGPCRSALRATAGVLSPAPGGACVLRVDGVRVSGGRHGPAPSLRAAAWASYGDLAGQHRRRSARTRSGL